MRTVEVQFHPLGEQWPGERTKPGARRRAVFRAKWGNTLDLMKRELEMLGAKRVHIHIDLLPTEIRNDGWPRSSARPRSPGVILSFDSRFGPLKYSCDRFTDWQDNIRAIALGLEHLRAVERYGITRKGEQYTGWKALPASTTPAMTTDAAAKWIAARSGWGSEEIMGSAILTRDAVRDASKLTHPDAGGTTEDFQMLQECKRVLEAHHGVKL